MEQYHNLIFSIAYKMTGSRTLSEDVVQDIGLKFLENPVAEGVSDPKNYTIRTTVNHCLNLLKRENRTDYPGIWLPEPVSDRQYVAPDSGFEQQDWLTYEMAWLLQELSPAERAVFILREGFDYSHKEIAEAMGISTENSRQQLKRARDAVKGHRHQIAHAEEQTALAMEYTRLIAEGDLENLIRLLHEDVTARGDGGGKAYAARVPVAGVGKVAQFLINIRKKSGMVPEVRYTTILRQPAIVIFVDGKCAAVQILSIRDGRIVHIFSQLNPDKLAAFNGR